MRSASNRQRKVHIAFELPCERDDQLPSLRSYLNAEEQNEVANLSKNFQEELDSIHSPPQRRERDDNESHLAELLPKLKSIEVRPKERCDISFEWLLLDHRQFRIRLEEEW